MRVGSRPVGIARFVSFFVHLPCAVVAKNKALNILFGCICACIHAFFFFLNDVLRRELILLLLFLGRSALHCGISEARPASHPYFGLA